MKFWNREAETMSRDAIEAHQLKCLRKTLQRVWASPWWRDLLQKRGMAGPEDVKSLDDLRNEVLRRTENVYNLDLKTLK